MDGPDHLLDEIAAAISDGDAIDWASAANRADAATRPFLTELRLLESVASHHREPPESADAAPFGGATPEDGEAGGTWGHLRLLDRVGAGAFGVVYRAWDTRLDREVALKLQAHLPGSTGDASPYQEGRVLARVRHPNVVTIYGAERRGTQVGLWMEFVHGRTLQHALAEGRSFLPQEVVAIGLELARALSAVHDAGLVHGDVKAQNVMLAEDDRVVLMDFGTGRDLAQVAAGCRGGHAVVSRARAAPRRTGVRAKRHLRARRRALPLADRIVSGRGRRPPGAPAGPMRPACRDAFGRCGPTSDGRCPQSSTGRRIPTRNAATTTPGPWPTIWRGSHRRGHCGRRRSWAARPSPWRGRRWRPAAGPWASPVRPRRCWPASRRGEAAPEHASNTPPVIAVQPFTNLGRDADSGLIVDGLTAEILHQLAIIDGLYVKSWDSSVAMRDRPLAEVRDRLGATLVLQGQVLWADSRVRLNVQLVDVASGVPLWSDRFDRDVADVLAVQDEISRAIVNRLRLKLGTGQRRYDADPQAYELYLKARALTDRHGFEDPAVAVDLFKQVIAMDEAFAPAHAGLANAYGWLSMFPLQTLSLRDALVVMRSAATTALELDPRLAEAHAAMGWVLSRERDWRGAEASFERAIALDPSLVSTHVGYSFSTLKPQERYADAERVLTMAADRDPLSLEVARERAALYLVSGRVGEAVALLERIRAEDERLPLVRRELGRALVFAGRAEEAIPLLEETTSQHYLDARLRPRRQARRRRTALRQHQAVANRKAVIAAALGDVDATFDALERQMVDEPHRVAQHLIQPEFALLRGHPRRTALRRALGLER